MTLLLLALAWAGLAGVVITWGMAAARGDRDERAHGARRDEMAARAILRARSGQVNDVVPLHARPFMDRCLTADEAIALRNRSLARSDRAA